PVGTKPGHVNAPHCFKMRYRLDIPGKRRFAKVERNNNVILRKRELAQHTNAVDVAVGPVLGRDLLWVILGHPRAIEAAHCPSAPPGPLAVEGVVEITGSPRGIPGHHRLRARRAHRTLPDLEYDVLH